MKHDLCRQNSAKKSGEKVLPNERNKYVFVLSSRDQGITVCPSVLNVQFVRLKRSAIDFVRLRRLCTISQRSKEIFPIDKFRQKRPDRTWIEGQDIGCSKKRGGGVKL